MDRDGYTRDRVYEWFEKQYTTHEWAGDPPQNYILVWEIASDMNMTEKAVYKAATDGLIEGFRGGPRGVTWQFRWDGVKDFYHAQCLAHGWPINTAEFELQKANPSFVPAPSPIIGRSEAAKIIGVTPQRVVIFARSGRLKGVKAGNDVLSRWEFRRADVEAFAAIERKGGRPAREDGS